MVIRVVFIVTLLSLSWEKVEGLIGDLLHSDFQDGLNAFVDDDPSLDLD
jgi:hypothetical protein